MAYFQFFDYFNCMFYTISINNDWYTCDWFSFDQFNNSFIYWLCI